MADVDKVREDRLRRMAERQGLTLQKLRRRDPRAIDYGKYRLLGRLPSDELLSLDEIEARLTVIPLPLLKKV